MTCPQIPLAPCILKFLSSCEKTIFVPQGSLFILFSPIVNTCLIVFKIKTIVIVTTIFQGFGIKLPSAAPITPGKGGKSLPPVTTPKPTTTTDRLPIAQEPHAMSEVSFLIIINKCLIETLSLLVYQTNERYTNVLKDLIQLYR